MSHANGAVLIVDDDPVFRSLLHAKLVHMASRIEEAEDGSQAWAAARKRLFDLAIVDYDMPGLDGMALIRCLRGYPSTQHMPIIMCTSHNSSSAMQEALSAGVSSFMTKPLNWSQFDRHIGHLLKIGGDATSESREHDTGASELRQELQRKDGVVTDLQGALGVFMQRHPGGRDELRRLMDRFLDSYHRPKRRSDKSCKPAA